MASKAIKHIKKKFQFQVNLTDEVLQAMEQTLEFVPVAELASKKPQKDQELILITEKNVGIKAFHLKLNGVNYFIPEPDPVSVYFHNAYVNFINIKQEKKTLLGVLNNTIVDEDMSKVLYSYFGNTNGYVIFLYTAIEAFVNRFIPEGYEHRLVRKDRTEVYNRDQIQRYLTPEYKLSNIITEITSKNFENSYPLKYIHIKNLKEFRNDIVHTKADSNGITPFNLIYKKALTFNYEETLLATRDLLNFYQPDCIESCPCNEDW